jgi:hypothetical protein
MRYAQGRSVLVNCVSPADILKKMKYESVATQPTFLQLV